MGSCRRLAAMRALVSALASHPIEREATAIVHAMGDLGSAWAWKTPSVAEHRDEEAAVRGEAAAALVNAFVGYERDVSMAASNALMKVDDPSTTKLVAEAKTTHPGRATALDGLSRRFARNPTR